MFSTSPVGLPWASTSGATEEITGILPLSSRSLMASMLTAPTAPTWPRSTSSPSTTVPRRVAVNSRASSPDMPMAKGP